MNTQLINLWNYRKLLAFLLALQITPGAALAAQNPTGATAQRAKFELTIDNIMRGSNLYGYEPREIRWSADSKRVYFQWKQASDPRIKDYDTYVVNRDGSELKKLTEEEAKNAPPANGDISKDKKQTVYVYEDDVFVYDNTTGQRRQITGTVDLESNAHFTRDGRRVYFTRSNNLFVMSMDSGALIQMTDIKAATGPQSAPVAGDSGSARGSRQQGTGAAAGEQRGTDSQEYIKKEERELLDIVKERAKKREEDEARRKRENPRKPLQLQARQSVQSLQLSPDEKYVVAAVAEAGEGVKTAIVPNYITESAYTEDIQSRTKVGDNQPRTRLAIIDAHTGEVKWVDHGQKRPKSDEAAATDKPRQAAKEAQAPSDPDGQEDKQSGSSRAERQGRAPDERDVALFQPVWSEDGAKAVLMARSADNKDRWILALDPTTGKTRVLASDHDDAWVGGPGVGGLGPSTLGWLADNDHVYFQSERDGYSHLYSVSYQSGEIKQLTSGKWEVVAVRLSDDKTRFQLTTSEPVPTQPGRDLKSGVESGPFQKHYYEMVVQGGARTLITSMPGSNQALASPDGKALAIVYSYGNKPPELYIQENRPQAVAVKVTSSPAPDFSEYAWIDPPIVSFTARDGAPVYARLYKPKDYRPGGPAVIFVHGAGYMQNVHHWWSSYEHEYLFHHFLMANGYMVMDVDYRGSAGYGRDWRVGIYRHMGGKDLDDQLDAAAWLVREHGVAQNRIGIYGGSYGGFITLMAMFTQPGVFAAGAALRPVTDWAHYNHPYTANILNLPQKDAEAYRKSSPIYFASGLKGALLICHGMADTNVHFQDTVRLTQKLIELHKENWQLAVYPVENHGFEEPSSWADEYKRIFNLFETNLKHNGQAGH
ncbi:MAG TPA: prolyl oligopeptidase family serine peptidase [Blastocatellia bacterium]|nr:prolyl oligopeptidase family serine peptidase [Blastocatellia bacterium]